MQNKHTEMEKHGGGGWRDGRGKGAGGTKRAFRSWSLSYTIYEMLAMIRIYPHSPPRVS